MLSIVEMLSIAEKARFHFYPKLQTNNCTDKKGVEMIDDFLFLAPAVLAEK